MNILSQILQNKSTYQWILHCLAFCQRKRADRWKHPGVVVLIMPRYAEVYIAFQQREKARKIHSWSNSLIWKSWSSLVNHPCIASFCFVAKGSYDQSCFYFLAHFTKRVSSCQQNLVNPRTYNVQTPWHRAPKRAPGTWRFMSTDMAEQPSRWMVTSPLSCPHN